MKKNIIIAAIAGVVIIGASVPFIVKASVARNNSTITEEQAKSTALTHAGIDEADVSYLVAKLDSDDGRWIYDVGFYVDGMEYYGNNAAGNTAVETKAKTAAAETTSDTTKATDISAAAANGSKVTAETEQTKTTTAAITADQAKEIALKDAGLAASDVTFVNAHLDYENGVLVYEVQFYSNGVEYDYDIDAQTGAIVSYDSDIEYYNWSDGNKTTMITDAAVTEESARAAALAHAGFAEADVTFTKSHLDYDDGRLEYEIEFYANNTEYEYTIDASTGDVISFDQESHNNSRSTGGNTGTGSNSIANGNYVTEDAVKNTVLARVPGAAATDVYLKFDYDDGRAVYEGSVYYESKEYDFEVDATTGEIIGWEVDSIHD